MQIPDLATMGRLQTTAFTVMPNHFKLVSAGTLNTAERIYNCILLHYFKRESLPIYSSSSSEDIFKYRCKSV